MTAATVYEDEGYIPGIKKGYISGANDYTCSFGFAVLKGAILTTSDDDEFASLTAISSGVGTIGVTDDAGAAVSTARTIYFIAWGDE